MFMCKQTYMLKLTKKNKRHKMFVSSINFFGTHINHI